MSGTDSGSLETICIFTCGSRRRACEQVACIPRGALRETSNGPRQPVDVVLRGSLFGKDMADRASPSDVGSSHDRLWSSSQRQASA